MPAGNPDIYDTDPQCTAAGHVAGPVEASSSRSTGSHSAGRDRDSPTTAVERSLRPSHGQEGAAPAALGKPAGMPPGPSAGVESPMQQLSAPSPPGSPMSPPARQHSHNAASGTLPRRGATSRLPSLRPPGPQGSAGDSPPPSRNGRSPGSADARSLNALLLGGGAARSGADAEPDAAQHHDVSPPSPWQQWRQQHPRGDAALDEAPTVNSLNRELRDPAAIRAAAAKLADRHLAENRAAQQRQVAEAGAPEAGQQQHYETQQQQQQQQDGPLYRPAAVAAHALAPDGAPQQENVLALKLTVVSGPSTDVSYVTAKDTRQVTTACSPAQNFLLLM